MSTHNRAFGDNAGKSAILAKVLCSLKIAGASFRAHLAQCMLELGYKSCNADPDLLVMPEFRIEDKSEYCSYILFCVDDILFINHDTDDVLNKLKCYVPRKSSSVGSSDVYLGTILMHIQLYNVHQSVIICKELS